ncbi:Uncharacterized protein BP5553_08413 [Venustampulla echinocandica]|uniref:DUF1996 domain-containing protein n=1 Tax=Venustampulla echinocandica TaxID=2656787 RepID=A0A370TE52_9HELO|nr:Uncharacterized protein BP5553_08413 [Venustampulla echinocandica]RDL32974.1 Uncharacterized protein BP5553_08413 [Venustampulla echinocandica]
MQWPTPALFILALAPLSGALIRFQCSQLVVQRLDPLVNPGMIPAAHVHQIVGGNSFNATMDPKKDMPGESTCTTCSFSEDFSNYWTAVLYFQAKNGTFKRVPQTSQIGGGVGGITVYYMQDALYDTAQKSKVTAFKPGFRMFVGDVYARTKAEVAQFRQLTYTCMENQGTRAPETLDFPNKPCKAGIMVNARFPTCWDGKNLDSPDHMAHMAYPASGTFESGGPCPSTHPVRMSQVLFEVVWDTSKFNNKADWPDDGRQPFVWSFGDATGYANHADYVFGWKGDALQKILDTPCVVNCAGAKTQTTANMNKCVQKAVVGEDIDGWLTELPGGHKVQYGPSS